jgi:hypothetical protein
VEVESGENPPRMIESNFLNVWSMILSELK